MTQKKAMIAMSGGVDSSVSAFLMQQAGYACIGAMMLLQAAPDTQTPAQDAQAVAERLGIPFHLYEFQEDFRRCVIDPFVSCYENGGTPNPCVYCNKNLKFDRLLEKALELDCDCIVTGHYARIHQDPATGRYLLSRAPSETKDQSYFLYSLSQFQLEHTRFPLGEMEKSQVRQIAEEQGFVNAHRHDSQDICFIPDGDYRAFLERYTGKHYPHGDFLTTDGTVVGTHTGAVGYTLGQRKGLGIALGEPAYVCGKDMEKNTVTVGPNSSLFHSKLLANDWNWISVPELTEPMTVTAKTRSRQKDQPATVYPMENGFARVEFEQPQRAITPGQAVVLYQGDLVVGGGTITEAFD